MHSELANGTMIDKYNDGNQQCKDEPKINAAFLKDQLQIDGIVLTKLQIPQWSPNMITGQTPNSIVNTFYLGKQPILGQQQIIEKQTLEKPLSSDKQQVFDKPDILEQPILAPLNGSIPSSVAPIDSMMNCDATINNQQTIDSNYSSNCHINNGYVSSDAHSLEYNNEYNNQNTYNSQSPINDGFNHDDSTKAAVKELFLPIMFSGFGYMGAGIILDSAQKWNVFKQIPQLIVLVPALLGLKGK